MSTFDRAKLHKDLDELDDEQFAEFVKLVQPFVEKKAQEGRPWAKELYALYESSGKDNSNPNTTVD